MVEVLSRVLNRYGHGFRVVERVPDHVQPVSVTELRGLVPLVGGQPHGLSATSPLHLDAPDPANRVSVARSGIRRREAPDVEADLQVPDALALPIARALVSDDDILRRQLA